MRIGHCQLESQCGDFAGNLHAVVESLARADREHIDIVCFPECFLTGYPDEETIARRDAFPVVGPRLDQVLDRTRHAAAAFIVGFNEQRGDDLYNTAAVIHQGRLLGTYSKCAAYMPFHKQGRSFPVFEHRGLVFGVVICADGGYIEPARILAAQGAKVIFAPHYNYIAGPNVLSHFMKVRADHIARAVENHVYFVRGNSVSVGQDTGIATPGVGYGDSYVIDPWGEIVVRSRRHVPDMIFCDIDTTVRDQSWQVGRSLYSFREYGHIMADVAARQLEKS